MPGHKPLEKSLREYLLYIAEHEPFSILIDAGAGNLISQLEERWPSVPAERKRVARALRRRIGELLKPLIDSVHPASVFRLIVEISPNSAVIPSHAVAPAISAAMDADAGHVHHLHSTMSCPAVDIDPPSIPLGLTILCHPVGLQNEKWTQELGAGGNLYAEEEHRRLQEMAAREVGSAAPPAIDEHKKRPIAIVRRDNAAPVHPESAKSQTGSHETGSIRLVPETALSLT